MSTIMTLLMIAASLLFIRAALITLGFYKEPILVAFQRYGDEVGFSPIVDVCTWGLVLVYLFFMLVVPSAFLLMFGIVAFVVFFLLYWRVKDSILEYPHLFLKFPRWYREIVDHTSREERRKLSYMWLGLPLRTRLLYNAQHDAFRKWVELVVISVA